MTILNKLITDRKWSHQAMPTDKFMILCTKAQQDALYKLITETILCATPRPENDARHSLEFTDSGTTTTPGELLRLVASIRPAYEESAEAPNKYGRHLATCNVNKQELWDEAQAAVNQCEQDEGTSIAAHEIAQKRKECTCGFNTEQQSHDAEIRRIAAALSLPDRGVTIEQITNAIVRLRQNQRLL